MNLTANELARIAWTQIWQLTALIVVVAVTTRVVCRNRPHLAHALWLVVLIKCVTPPLWSSPSGIFCWVQTSSEAVVETETTPETAYEAVASSDGNAKTVFVEPFPLMGEHAAGRLAAEGLAAGGLATHKFPPRPTGSAVDLSISGSDAAALSEQPTATDHSVKVADEISTGTPIRFTFWIVLWLSGSALMAVVAGIRLLACFWSVKQSGWRHDPELDALVARLSKKLKLRRRVRLIVTNSRVGPAVVGLFRPVILLPEIMVRGKSQKDLEPILIHELVHVRRGDLWVGLLQVIASATWWFHPLVWLTGRFASREAECCCDEESIAALGGDPAKYAHTLLDVVELKQALRPVPSFPGVRPVEITSKRLERIMSLGQGCHKRTPWWCWLCVIVVGVAVLPGAALLVLAEGEPKDLSPIREPNDLAWPLQQTKAANPADPQRPLITRVYNVSDLLKKLTARPNVDAVAAKRIVKGWVKASCWDRAKNGGKATTTIQWFGTELVIRKTRKQHDRIAKQLKMMRKFGFEEVLIVARVVMGPPKEIESIQSQWKMFRTEIDASEDILSNNSRPQSPPSIDRPLPGKTTKPRGIARMNVETNLPVVYEIMDNRRGAEVIDSLKNLEVTSILSPSKVSMFNGRTVSMLVGSQRPFVVGIANGKPRIRVISDGLQMKLRPLSRKDGSVWLDLDLTLSDIRDVKTVTFQRKPGQKPLTLQVPTVAKTRLNSSVVLQPGKTLLIGGLKKTDKHGKPQSILLMLRTSKFRLRIPAVTAKLQPVRHPANSKRSKVLGAANAVVPAAATNRETGKRKDASKQKIGDRLVVYRYPVADLVVPFPGKLLLMPRNARQVIRHSGNTPNMKPLIKLITTRVTPKSWKSAGGDGLIEARMTMLSVVVRQTPAVHARIRNLLSRLRRLQDIQVTLAVKTIEISETDPLCQQFEQKLKSSGLHHTSAILPVGDARSLMKFVPNSKFKTLQRTKITLLRNQAGAIPSGLKSESPHKKGVKKLLIASRVSADRRSIRLRVALDAANALDALATVTTAVVPDGRTVLIDIDDLTASQSVPLQSFTRGDIERVVGRKPSSKSKRVFLFVTPRIIVQEEELIPKTLR